MDNSGNNQGQKKKKRSPLDDVQSVRSTINNARTIINVARFAFNPWIIVGIIIFIIIYMLFFGGGSSSGLTGGSSGTTPAPGTGTGSLPPIPGLTINLTADDAVGNGVPINYTVSITYNPPQGGTPIDQITLYDALPTNTTFTNTSGKASQNGNTISWPLSDTSNQSSFTFTLTPTADDINVSNYVYAMTAASETSSLPPISNNCGDPGYQSFMAILPDHLNFGDPNCEVTSAYNNPVHRDLMYSYLQSLDPQNAILWFYCIAYGESSWDPNAYNPKSTSGYGAYGLFQMNPAGKGVNQYDAGDVDWRTQIQNAVNYNKEDNGQFDVFTGGGTVTSELYKDANGNFQCGHALGPGGS